MVKGTLIKIENGLYYVKAQDDKIVKVKRNETRSPHFLDYYRQSGYKYIVNVDGHVSAFRLTRITI